MQFTGFRIIHCMNNDTRAHYCIFDNSRRLVKCLLMLCCQIHLHDSIRRLCDVELCFCLCSIAVLEIIELCWWRIEVMIDYCELLCIGAGYLINRYVILQVTSQTMPELNRHSCVVCYNSKVCARRDAYCTSFNRLDWLIKLQLHCLVACIRVICQHCMTQARALLIAQDREHTQCN